MTSRHQGAPRVSRGARSMWQNGENRWMGGGGGKGRDGRGLFMKGGREGGGFPAHGDWGFPPVLSD